MILKDYIGVVWRNYPLPDHNRISDLHFQLLKPSEFDDLQKQERVGDAVILEAWSMGERIVP